MLIRKKKKKVKITFNKNTPIHLSTDTLNSLCKSHCHVFKASLKKYVLTEKMFCIP